MMGGRVGGEGMGGAWGEGEGVGEDPLVLHHRGNKEKEITCALYGVLYTIYTSMGQVHVRNMCHHPHEYTNYMPKC